MTFIYAARVSGRVVYVGISRNPWYRLRSHRQNARSIAKRDGLRKLILSGEVSFYIIRVTNRENAHRLEGQIISAFKRKGQCEYNSVVIKGGNPIPGDPRFLGPVTAGNFRDNYPPGTSMTPILNAIAKKCIRQGRA